MAKARSYDEDDTLPALVLLNGCYPIGMRREIAAEYLSVSLAAFDKLDGGGDLPRPKAIGSLRVWDRLDLDQFRLLQSEKRMPACPTATVYVVGIPGFVKIGITTRSVAGRIAGLQTGCPYPISLLNTFAGTRMTEAHFHNRFNDYRAAGEWFRHEGAVAEWIEEGCPI